MLFLIKKKLKMGPNPANYQFRFMNMKPLFATISGSYYWDFQGWRLDIPIRLHESKYFKHFSVEPCNALNWPYWITQFRLLIKTINPVILISRCLTQNEMSQKRGLYQLHCPKQTKKKGGETELPHIVVSKTRILATISQYIPLWGKMSSGELLWERSLLIQTGRLC